MTQEHNWPRSQAHAQPASVRRLGTRLEHSGDLGIKLAHLFCGGQVKPEPSPRGKLLLLWKVEPHLRSCIAASEWALVGWVTARVWRTCIHNFRMRSRLNRSLGGVWDGLQLTVHVLFVEIEQSVLWPTHSQWLIGCTYRLSKSWFNHLEGKGKNKYVIKMKSCRDDRFSGGICWRNFGSLVLNYAERVCLEHPVGEVVGRLMRGNGRGQGVVW